MGVGKAAVGPFFRGLWQVARSGASVQFAGCPQVNRSQAKKFPVHIGTGGLQRKFRSGTKAAERQNAMHQTTHCQEVHA